MSMQERRNSLIDHLKSQRVIIVVGTGVAAAVTGADSTIRSWRALIESGIDYVEQHAPNDGFREYVVDDLDKANRFPDALTSAAQKVETALGGRTSNLFAEWLREAVGNASIEDVRLLRAICSLGAPIATFNYDTLIEQSSTRGSCSWSEPVKFRNAIAGVSKDIAHLHGVWSDPESIVFGSQGYGTVVANDPLQALQRAIASLRCILFVGCGEGLADPNMGRLLSWLGKTFGNEGMQHYRLCLASEVDRLQSLHAAEPIEPIVYGDAHSDLSAFVEALTPSANSLVAPGDPLGALKTTLVDDVRDDNVLSTHMSDLENRPIERMLVQPVVLPVSQEQYSEARRNDELPDVARSDVEGDLNQFDFLVLAAPESSGLTSALRWITSRWSELSPAVYPLVLDYVGLTGLTPLDRAIRKALRQAQVAIAPSDSLPPLALAIDNFMPSSKASFERVLSELESFAPAAKVILGCREGAEIELVEALGRHGIRPTIRYLGLMNEIDITEMAALVHPEQSEAIARKAANVIRREHLTRTPLNISLLISVILQGEALLSSASGSALLDAYVSLLLGRGNPYDDSRYVFDAEDRESMLSALAEKFVDADSGQISESEAVEALEQYFDEVRWSESASAALADLARRHVIVIRDGRVRFTQSSFLHLFCAKRAKRKSFREKLLLRPLRYTRILQIYAALMRDDETLLNRMLELVTDSDLESSISRGPMLSPITYKELPSDVSVDRLVENFSGEVAETPDEDHNPNDLDSLDEIDDTDVLPFPDAQIDDAPTLVKVVQILNLVSIVLRDSEQVSNSLLKRDLLINTLRYWGYLTDCLDADDDFKEFMRGLAAELAGVLEVPAEKIDGFKERFAQMSPLLAAMGGVNAHLTSRKLFRSLLEAFDVEDFVRDAGGAVMGATLAWNIRERGWASTFGKLQEHHNSVVAVTLGVRNIALNTYQDQVLSSQDEKDLLEFLGNQLVLTKEARTMGHRELLARKSQRMTSLQAARLQRRASGGLIEGVGENESP